MELGKIIIPISTSLALLVLAALPQESPVLDRDRFQPIIERFNADDEELYPNLIRNREAWSWMRENVPFFECPDDQIQKIYYFRWWTYRKHIKKTPDGFVLTEFLAPVGHSGKHNTDNCAAGLHFREGRWLHDAKYLDDYARFWLRSNDGKPQPYYYRYSNSSTAALWERYKVNLDQAFVVDLLADLVEDYRRWEHDKLLPSGLFWQSDNRDGMEVSISGAGLGSGLQYERPTINSYMYGNARAIAAIARLAGKDDVAEAFDARAERIKALVQERLWDPEAKFFKTRRDDGTLANVRELIGLVPWMFHVPAPGTEAAWNQLMDPKGFFAPYGPTTAEQRHPKYAILYEGDHCQWNGPSWPFTTSMTLSAMANLLNDYDQSMVTADDYFRVLKIYASSHALKRPDGRVVPWIDENLHPHTGEWVARARKIEEGQTQQRGKDYNHSSFCDLIISGLVGLRPRADDQVVVNPLIPESWDWFALDRVRYHGALLSIVWDRDGSRYGRGKGLTVWAEGKKIAHSKSLEKVTGVLK